MTDAKVLPFPVDSLEPPPRNRRVEEHLRAAVDDLTMAIEEGSRPMEDAQQEGQPAAGTSGEMAERASEPTTPQTRAAAGLERVIAALSEELRKTQVKLAAARQKKESVHALQSAIATLEYRMEKARGFRKQVKAASSFVTQVEKDLEGSA